MEQRDGSFQEAADLERTTLVADFIDFVRDTRKWWIIPIVGILLILGGLITLASTGAAPFVYTLF